MESSQNIVALLSHGSKGNGFSNPALSFACPAGKYLSVDEVNQLIQNGVQKEFLSSSLNDLVGVEDDLLKLQFPSAAKKMKPGPAIVNTGLFLGKDIAKRIPLYVFREAPNDANGKPPVRRTYVSLGSLLTSKDQQKIGIPPNKKLIILCCRVEDGRDIPENLEVTGKYLTGT